MRSVIALFWIQAATFALTLIDWIGVWLGLFPGALRDFGRSAFPILVILLLLAGLALLIQAVRHRKEVAAVWLRRGLILTGAASTATGLGVLLHNVFEGTASLMGEWALIRQALEVLGVAFFFVGLTAPILFLVCVAFTAVLLLRRTGSVA